MAHRPYNNLQRREFRVTATLPTHIEFIQIAGPGINISNFPSVYDQTWETDRLCIVKLNSRSGVGGLPLGISDDNRNLPGNDLRLYGVSTPDNFFSVSGDIRKTSLSTILDSSPRIEVGQWLIDQDFPLWIRRIDYRTSNRVCSFNVYYFD